MQISKNDFTINQRKNSSEITITKNDKIVFRINTREQKTQTELSEILDNYIKNIEPTIGIYVRHMISHRKD